MARRVFFSFHFDHDCWRANQVRQANVVLGSATAGYFDHSEYEDARRRGNEAIRKMILRHLEGTSVTVVLIGTHTANRPWVQFEIAESVKRDNGLVGIQVHHLAGGPPWWRASSPGPIPYVPPPAQMPVYIWDPQRVRGFAQVIEQAARRGEQLRADKTEARRRALRALSDLNLPRIPPPAPGRPRPDYSTVATPSLPELRELVALKRALSLTPPPPPPASDLSSALARLLAERRTPEPAGRFTAASQAKALRNDILFRALRDRRR